jgi:excisionase family DNA binding protein
MKGKSMSTDALTKPSLFDPLLSVNDVMEVLGASRTSVYAWLRGGKLRGVKLGDMTKVRRSELQRFMSELPAARYVESCYSRRAAQGTA